MTKLALLLTAFVAASLFSPSAMAEPSSAAPGPRPGSAEAMDCLLRQGPPACERMFVGRAWVAARPLVFHDPNRDFKRGALVFARYWGPASKTNIFDARIMIAQPVSEMDIFHVRYAHFEYTYYVAPADADGRIRGLAIRPFAPRDPRQLSRGARD